ncbi:MAG: D-2-hydroxyacid dehydrogenase family protein [Hyphomicrobiaceae bacterium]
MASIAILDDYQGVALKMADWSALQRQHQIKVFRQPFANEDAAATALADFEIVCLMRERTPFPASLFARLPKLKLAVTTGMRNASVDVAAAAKRGVVVCGTPSGGHATAELAFGLILSIARNIPSESQVMRQGGWQTTVGQDLRGKTLGIVGLGKLGSQLAAYAKAFGMTVIAWSQNLTTEKAAAGGAELVTKHELFTRADFVSIHTVLSERSRGLVGANELAAMKPTSAIINTSRGPIIDGAALLAALQEGRIAAAGLDVYDSEPLAADHPLRSEPRALLTPHLGYVTEETYRLFYGGTVAAIEGWLAGKPVNLITT